MTMMMERKIRPMMIPTIDVIEIAVFLTSVKLESNSESKSENKTNFIS